MPITILSVDDSKMVRMLVTKAFKKFDCRVLEASNGIEGMAIAAQEKPDLILLDFTMPVMDGMEMLDMLRSHEDLKTVPVVMLTAERSRDMVAEFAKKGVRDYLVKPFREQEIVERVGRIVPLVVPVP
jgi:two-component system, cell cycle response regulator